MTSRLAIYTTICVVFSLQNGCGVELRDPSEFRFLAPLIIEKEEVASAIIDTGGGYEILLRHTYDLPVLDEVDVITFRGQERVEVVGPFNYATGAIGAVANGAIVGISTCDCNGLGFEFFRKTGLVLALDFDTRQAAFLDDAPSVGVSIPFTNTPEALVGFDAAFLRVVVDINGRAIPATALVDTGATRTIIQSAFVENFVNQQSSAIEVTISQSQLGGVKLTANLFDNEALPDIIIGLDVMSVWGGQWYFDFNGEGGRFTVLPRTENQGRAKSISPVINSADSQSAKSTMIRLR